ncbi:MAG: rhomboid family intramembrane serine protease [Oscillospiraceae bacterium]|nr:rhomboid family intramembrane serine protease [Oscillospiraceae bacterium]
MKNLRKRFNLFCYRHSSWGIPNLMLYVVLGSAIISVLTMVTRNPILFNWLCFDKAKILQGQVWRLVSYVLIDRADDSIINLLFLYFFYMLGRHVETSMGTLRFNLFYFTGVILMDIFAMIFSPADPINSAIFSAYLYSQMGFYLHLSLLLVFAASNPNAHFLMFFIIPIKSWIMSLIYLTMVLINIVTYLQAGFPFPTYLFPLVGIANFLLFTGKDVVNVLPPAWRPSGYRHVRVNKPPKKAEQPPKQAPKQVDYTHRCTVCGRTDVSNPELEFRYCSRCNGYYCYCEDHINNHTHVE